MVLKIHEELRDKVTGLSKFATLFLNPIYLGSSNEPAITIKSKGSLAIRHGERPGKIHIKRRFRRTRKN